MSNKTNYIYTFDALRGIAAVLIFLNHCNFMNNAQFTGIIFEHLFHNGSFSVMFFFVLSGFCMERRYSQASNAPISLKVCFNFAVSKVRKFYLLYVLTMLYVFIYEVLVSHESLITTGLQFLMSLTLLQTLSIKYWGILNSAAWFLSVLFILYFIFPILTKILNKIHNIIILLIVCELFYIVVNFACLCLTSKGILSQNISELLTYVSPLYWIPCFFVGMGITKLKCINAIEKHGSRVEIIAICFAAVVYILGLNISGDQIVIFRHFFYITVAAVIVYVFSHEKGNISIRLSNSRIGILGHYSLEIYLIHFPLINYGGRYLLSVIPDSNVTIVLKMIILFCVTLIISLLVKKFENIVYKKALFGSKGIN